MLRCAQMVLGETLLRRHIGRVGFLDISPKIKFKKNPQDYKWKRDTQPEGDYEKILRMFLDEKSALYSIHQIGKNFVRTLEKKTIKDYLRPFS